MKRECKSHCRTVHKVVGIWQCIECGREFKPVEKRPYDGEL